MVTPLYIISKMFLTLFDPEGIVPVPVSVPVAVSVPVSVPVPGVLVFVSRKGREYSNFCLVSCTI
ncbi:hypothetical protein Plhal304r1_c022g0078411 [Plasmopara halstedii]